MPSVNHQDRSLGELFAELSQETSALVRSEVRLATTELTAKAARIGRDASKVALGGAVAHAGLLALVAAAVLLLVTLGVAPWMAAAIVGVVVGGSGYVMAQIGLSALKRDDMTPQRTIDSMKETAEWVKNETR